MNLEEAAKLTHEQWREMAAELMKTAETRLFIGGKFVDAIDGGTFDNINPVDGTLINKCAAGKAADIDKAVKIAKASFKSGALQVVNGLGEEAGQALARHMDVS